MKVLKEMNELQEVENDNWRREGIWRSAPKWEWTVNPQWAVPQSLYVHIWLEEATVGLHEISRMDAWEVTQWEDTNRRCMCQVFRRLSNEPLLFHFVNSARQRCIGKWTFSGSSFWREWSIQSVLTDLSRYRNLSIWHPLCRLHGWRRSR